MLGGVDVRIVDEVGDFVEGEPEFAVEHDLLQALKIVVAVPPITGARPDVRREQPDLVVVVQGAHRNSGESSDLANRVAHRSLLGLDARPSRYVRVKPFRPLAAETITPP